MARIGTGHRAPDFELPASDGKTYRLSDLRGRPVVLAFYPNDMGPVCTKQLCSYSDDWDALTADGAVVLGISKRGLDSKEEFAQRHGIKVPLLADEDGRVAAAYGVEAPFGRMQRAVFLVDAEGVVRWVQRSFTGARYVRAEDIAERVRTL